MIKWSFVPQIWHEHVFWGEKTDWSVRFEFFKNFDPFCDVTDPQFCPKWSKKHLNSHKSRWMITFSSNLARACFFGVRKPGVVSEFQNLKMLTLLWRHGPPLLPKMFQKTPKSPEISIKWLFFPQIWHVYVYWGGKTNSGVRIPKF